jgi:hypothetical protein
VPRFRSNFTGCDRKRAAADAGIAGRIGCPLQLGCSLPQCLRRHIGANRLLRQNQGTIFKRG